MPFKPFRMTITIRDPDEAQEFLEGCILAQSNNNSQYFRELIEGLNNGLYDYRQELIAQGASIQP